MASEDASSRTFIRLFKFPLLFAGAGLIWSALNDVVAVAISYWNGMYGKLFALNGVHNQYLVWLHVAVAYIVFPSVWAFFAWTGQAPRRMFRNLSRDGVFTEVAGCTEETGAPYLGFNRRSWVLLWAVGMLLVLAGSYFLWSSPPTHESGIVYYIRSHLPSTLVLWLMLWLILCRTVETILTLDRVFHNKNVCLRPFHPDHVGGFGALKRYTREWLFFTGFVFFGLLVDFVQTVSIRRDPRDVILLVYIWAFVLLVPVLLWATAWPAHAAMIRERDRILRSLIPHDWRRASFAHADDAASIRRQLDQAEATRHLHDTIMAFPVWPFHIWAGLLVPLGESFAAAVVAHLLVNMFSYPR